MRYSSPLKEQSWTSMVYKLQATRTRNKWSALRPPLATQFDRTQSEAPIYALMLQRKPAASHLVSALHSSGSPPVSPVLPLRSRRYSDLCVAGGIEPAECSLQLLQS
jgi:hypothetical protein